MKTTASLLIFLCFFLKSEAQIFERQGKNYVYYHKFSPLIGASQWSYTSLDLGICSEYYWGKDVFQTRTKYTHFIVHSLSAEISLEKHSQVLPKYSFWFHSTKLSIFTFGLSTLYRKENGIFIRPEVGITFPKESEYSLFRVNTLKFKLSYGYNLALNKNILPAHSNLNFVIYLGNNRGGIKALR